MFLRQNNCLARHFVSGSNTGKNPQINIIYFKHAFPILVSIQSSGLMKQIKPRLTTFLKFYC